MNNKIYNAIILNDYSNSPGIDRHYCTNVYLMRKTLETRMKMFKYSGDIVLCCGNKSVTRNAGKALCLLHFGKGRPMVDSDEEAAMIDNVPGRIVYPLTNRRQFNRFFDFAKCRVGGSFQSIFQIKLPKDVIILED